MKTLPDDQREVHDALEVFETSLNTPVVSGELEDWTVALKSSWDRVQPAIQRQLDGPHRSQIKEIGKQDPELLPRVEQLKQEDEQIAQQLRNLSARIEKLSVYAPRIEPNEGKVQDDLTNLIEEGMALVNRVRKQEVGIQTWFMEAFNRDLGTGD
jgi:chromosome segregation ATPase